MLTHDFRKDDVLKAEILWAFKFCELIVVLVSYLIHHDTLLQNATDDIRKHGSYYITKCVDFITKCDSYYKLRRLFQNASVQGTHLTSIKP